MSGYYQNGERKRPNVFGEDSQENLQGGPKKLKGNSQGTPSYIPTPIPSLPPPPPPQSFGSSTIDPAIIAKKRAEVQAKLAAMKLKMSGGGIALPSSAPPPPPPPSSASSSSTARSYLPPVPGLPTPNLDPDLAKKVADAKKLVESFQAKSRLAAAKPINPYLSQASQRKNEPILDPSQAGRGGLNMAAHPLLMDNSAPTAQTKKDKYRPMTPMFSTTKANSRVAPPPRTSLTSAPSTSTAVEPVEESEFFDPRLSYGVGSAAVKAHMGRGPQRERMQFNQKGKFVRMGEALRAEARMEELKKRILESAKKAGLESEMEDQAKVIKRPPPPEIEWWDAPFLPSKSYDSFSPEFLDTTDTITIYIQHPIQIPAPQDKIIVDPKALFLTKKEQKKMRRQRRMAELRDKQDRIKMGLLPTPKPKVKLSNMMRVLTQDAISDPTKIEGQVRREMVARERGHLKANAEKKLNPDQVWEKEQAKLQKDADKGIGAMCYKIRYLTNPGHKLKVKKTAEADGLTGIIIYNPKYCLVVVEGGAKGLKHYKQLMTHRIDWTEEARSKVETVSTGGEGGEVSSIGAMGELAEPISLADNTCSLIWAGSHKERLFRGFRQHNCPSDSIAKEVLGARLEGLWDVARTEGKEEED